MTTLRLAVSLSLCLDLTIAGCSREPAPTTPLDGGAEPDVALTRPADLPAVQPDTSLQIDVKPRWWDECFPSEKRWCDGLQYDGWGLVDCDPSTGKWKTTIVNGKSTLDCQESTGGRRPNTICACYHFFTNFTCCERTDCVLPAGTQGQICPASKGGLCDFCNPLVKGECKEPGAVCVVTNSHESFCGRDCSSSACPAGYNCLTVKQQVGTAKQCIPSSFSCYF
jgi:hypothetical protein